MSECGPRKPRRLGMHPRWKAAPSGSPSSGWRRSRPRKSTARERTSARAVRRYGGGAGVAGRSESRCGARAGGAAGAAEFFQEQQADLEPAADGLEQAIRRLDQVSQERFTEYVRSDSQTFDETFRRLFGGGRAELSLLEDGGVDVHVQMPGKRSQHLLALSGGERALTAIALIFALLRVQPSPFYVLDEIDSALDEANLGRFQAMLREAAQDAQFIVITHRATTMEVADTLYGVTAAHPGVSSVVSLNLQEAIATTATVTRGGNDIYITWNGKRSGRRDEKRWLAAAFAGRSQPHPHRVEGAGRRAVERSGRPHRRIGLRGPGRGADYGRHGCSGHDAHCRRLAERVKEERPADEEGVKRLLQEEIVDLLKPVARSLAHNDDGMTAMLVVGVNGAGKTTTIGKLAQRFHDDGKRVIIGAGDTFRAAAIEQLQTWGQRTGATVIAQQAGADPAAVAFDAAQAARARGADVLMVDTAGRLQTRSNLMDELSKVHRMLVNQLGRPLDEVLLVLDATTGQNGLSQARLFSEAVPVSGIALTKLDGTAKGGIIVAIAEELKLPVKLVGVGEQVDDLQDFRSGGVCAGIVCLTARSLVRYTCTCKVF